MTTYYRCDHCGEEFRNARECRTHESSHIVDFQIIIKILSQLNLFTTKETTEVFDGRA